MKAILLLICVAVTGSAYAAEPEKKEEPKKAAGAAAAADVVVGEMQVLTLPAMTFAYGSSETTFEKIMEPIGKYLPLLSKAMEEGKLRSKVSAMFVYKGVQEDMSKPFTLEVGWIVAEGAKDVEGLKVRKTEAFKCATLLFTGPVSKIAAGYEKLMPAVMAAKLTPVGESREVYLYFEGLDSPNNVVQLQVGVK